jgi:trimeric autotransporter adhesin
VMKFRSVAAAVGAAVVLAACGGGGGSGSDGGGGSAPPPTTAPTVSLSFGLKEVALSWTAVPDATFYRVLKNPDNTSGYTQLGGDLTGTSFSDTIAVHATDWINASYKVQGCTDGGCIDSPARFVVPAESAQAIGYVKASNTGANDFFGQTLSLSADGNTLAVGTPGEDGAAAGVEGNQSDESANSAGAVYVFTRSGNTWMQQAYVKASNTGANDVFGAAVSLSADGNTLAVGAREEDSAASGIGGNQNDASAASAGAAYVFTRSGSTWTQQAYVKASNAGAFDRFGQALSLSADGNTLAVGAIGEDSAAVGIGGDQTNESASNAGAVYVFTRSGSAWTQQAYVKASNTGANDSFGRTLSLSADGNTLAVGAIGEGSAAVGIGGDQTNESASNAGAVYVFTRSGSTWTQQAYVKASNAGATDRFGQALSLSADGNTLAVGAPEEDSAASGIGGNQNDASAGSAGAVYVFTRSGSTWTQQAYVKASNTGAIDGFGTAVSLSADGRTLAVGAVGEDSAALGIGGNQNDGNAPGAGAVYLY